MSIHKYIHVLCTFNCVLSSTSWALMGRNYIWLSRGLFARGWRQGMAWIRWDGKTNLFTVCARDCQQHGTERGHTHTRSMWERLRREGVGTNMLKGACTCVPACVRLRRSLQDGLRSTVGTDWGRWTTRSFPGRAFNLSVTLTTVRQME